MQRILLIKCPGLANLFRCVPGSLRDGFGSAEQPAIQPAIQPAKNNYAAAANFSLFVGIKWKFWKSLECSYGAIGWLASEIKIQPHALRSLFYGSPAAGLFIRNVDTGKTSSFNQEYGLGS